MNVVFFFASLSLLVCISTDAAEYAAIRTNMEEDTWVW
jgi:hypothetical protein